MQVMWNRLISVFEKQALALFQAAFSTSVLEAGDLSAGIFDRSGRMLVQAVTGTFGLVNSIADAVPHFIHDIGPGNIFEGNFYITNDPWKGTGHLHDFMVVTPSFLDGVLVGYCACTAHVVDVGGRGFGPDAREIYEEGICVPIMKFAERDEINRNLINIMHNNVRESDKVIAPEVPNNAASLSQLSVRAPEGCILNACGPARWPCATCWVISCLIWC